MNEYLQLTLVLAAGVGTVLAVLTIWMIIRGDD